jgi:hypothetical protein
MAEGTRVSQLIETVSGMKQQQEAQQQNQQNQQQILEDIVLQLRNMSTRMDQMAKAQGKRPMGSPPNSPPGQSMEIQGMKWYHMKDFNRFSSNQSDWSFPGSMEMILLVGYTRPINSFTFTTLQLNTDCL